MFCRASRAVSTDVAVQQLSPGSVKSDTDDSVKDDTHSKALAIAEDANSSKMSYARAALIGKERTSDPSSKKPDEQTSTQNDPSVAPEINCLSSNSTPSSPPTSKRSAPKLSSKQHTNSGSVVNGGRAWKGRPHNDYEQKAANRVQREFVDHAECYDNE